MNPALAAKQAAAFGFSRYTGDWRELVCAPAIDAVDICAPNFLHKEMALEAIRHGKHAYSEKPLTVADAEEMVSTARGRETPGRLQLHEKSHQPAGERDYCAR
ncbi:Gfo/Idh/MocA family protein [Candidatus Pantoea persica]|uniref:Gfo/Idh/MocA family protein n=1 Tax=Candidatus Pantoea persica TaxID=2518128 RepID=UPI0035A8BA88|nr:MFS transporter [Candidatus Pantoea persica]